MILPPAEYRKRSLLLDEQAQGNVVCGCRSDYSDCYKAPECWFLIGAKLLNGERHIPVGNVMPCHVGMSQKVVGSNPGAGKGIFLMMSQVKCTCTILSSRTLNFIQM